MNTQNIVTSDMLERMAEKIYKTRPQIQKIKDHYGALSYFTYVKQKNRINPQPSFLQRKKEMIDAVQFEVSRLLGTAIGENVAKQLKKNDSVSTAEHTAPIGTAHTLGAGLQEALPMFDNPDPRFQNVIILSCSSVSFGNDLSFSRGFPFHLFSKNEVVDSSLNFFGRSTDAESVMYAGPYGMVSIDEMKKKLATLQREGQLSDEKKTRIESLVTTIYASPHALSGNDFVDQLSITNYYFWKQLFPVYKQSQIPNYLMLSQEKILLYLLKTYHLKQDSPIHRLIFQKKYLDLIPKYFDGMTGAFNTQNNSGTFLFWGYSKKDHTRFQLFREGNVLVNSDKTYTLALTPDAIEEAISNKEIFPGLLLTFITLSFYYGLYLGGGPSQTSYLTQMKEGYISMMKELEDEQSSQDTQASITDDFIFYRPNLAFLQSGSERISATALDMYLYQDSSRWKEVVRATKEITINEFMTILFPILYKQFCPIDEREDVLMNLSRQAVENYTGFDKKLPVLAEIPHSS